MEPNFHRDNHFVSCAYLKWWATSENQIWVYRTLVPHQAVRVWKRTSVKGVAYHSHLYTRLTGARETDDFERWLEKEFETPAEEVLRKVTLDQRLTPRDWNRLIRFLAAQDVRTPARLLEDLQRWQQELPELLDATLRESVKELEQARKEGRSFPPTESGESQCIPMRVIREIGPGKVGRLGVEVLPGRGLWLWSMRHTLTKTLDVLHQHTWRILRAPSGMSWFTSDDPVIKLNYNRPGEYDFKGGWGSHGSEILFPLTPQHLLYTQIGHHPDYRREVPRHEAIMIRRLIVEHAHRMIFATAPDSEVMSMRPRTVDASAVHEENEQWQMWHEQQTAAEIEIMGSGSTR